MDPRRYEANVVLKDGGSVQFRAIRPDDRERLRSLLGRVSSESLYFRFFGLKRKLSEDDLVKLTDLDFFREAALVATLRGEGEERIVGVGRYSAIDPPGEPLRRAEVAFLVEDAHQGRGIGTLLMEHLAPIARSRGITEFEADVLGENNRMLEVFQKSGFVIQRSFESGVFLQREVKGGVEALVGVTTDPTFGPLVVAGLGGVLVELLKEVSFRLTPVSDLDAEEMVEKLRSKRLLDGYRGAPPADRAALLAVIQRISALVEVIPELLELDLNPVKILPPGKGAIVVDGRMRIGPLPA